MAAKYDSWTSIDEQRAHLLIASSLLMWMHGAEGAKTGPPARCQRGKKSVSDRPLAAESIILIEGGMPLVSIPRARSFIIDTAMPAAAIQN